MGDENDEYHQAVLAQAQYLGIEPEEDADFLWLAEEALKAELPEGWEMVMGEGEHEGVSFYYNEELNESTWEHPLDGYYRDKFKRLKAGSSSYSSRRGSAASNREGGGSRRGSAEETRDRHDETVYYDQDEEEQQQHISHDEDQEEREGWRRGSRGNQGGGRKGDEEEDGYDDFEKHERSSDREVGRRGSKHHQAVGQRSLTARQYKDESEEEEEGNGPGGGQRSVKNNTARSWTGGWHDAEEGDDEEEAGPEGGGEAGCGGQQASVDRKASTTQQQSAVVREELEEIEVEDVESFELEPSPPREEGVSSKRGGTSAAAPHVEESRGGAAAVNLTASIGKAEGGGGLPDKRSSSYDDDEEEKDDTRRNGGPTSTTKRRSHEEEEEDDDHPTAVGNVGSSMRREEVTINASIAARKPFSHFSDEEEEEDDERRGRKGGNPWQTAVQSDDDDEDFDAPDHHVEDDRRHSPTTTGPVSSKAAVASSKSTSIKASSQGSTTNLVAQGHQANDEVLKALEAKLAEAASRVADLQHDLEEAQEREKDVVRIVRQQMDKEHFLEAERLKEEKETALRVASDEWTQERQELIRMRKEAHEETEELESKVMALERQIKELKADFYRAQQEGASGLQHEEVEERISQACKETEDEWQSKVNEVQKKAREREEALTEQLEAQITKTDQLEEDKGKIEESLANMVEEVENLKTQLEEEKAIRQHESKIAQEHIEALEVALEEAKANLDEGRHGLDDQLEKAMQEAQAAVNERNSLLGQLETLIVKHTCAEAALTATSRELSDSQALVTHLRTEMAEHERALTSQKQEILAMSTKRSFTADREKTLEMEVERVKNELEISTINSQRKLADLQNAYNALQKEMHAGSDDAARRIREIESAKDLLEYEKKRSEERAAAAETWRQKESARAKQAELALESMRDELGTLKAQIPGLDEAKAIAQVPLRSRVNDLEQQLEVERKNVEEAQKQLAAHASRHEEHILKLKDEVAAKLPSIAASALKKVEEEWKRRVDDECRLVRDAGEHEAEHSHLRNVALKAQLVEVQAKLQSQVASEKMTSQSLSRLVNKLEDENRAMRRELEMRGGGYYTSNRSGGGGSGVSSSSHWEQTVQASTINLIQGHLQMLQAQMANATSVSSSSARSPAVGGRGGLNHQNNMDSSSSPSTTTKTTMPMDTTMHAWMKSTSSNDVPEGDISINTAAVLDQDERLGWSSSVGEGGSKPPFATPPRQHHQPPTTSSSSSSSSSPSSPPPPPPCQQHHNHSSRPSSAPLSRPGLASADIPTGLIDDGTAFGFYEGYWRSKYATNDDLIGGGYGLGRTRVIHSFDHSPVLKRAGARFR